MIEKFEGILLIASLGICIVSFLFGFIKRYKERRQELLTKCLPRQLEYLLVFASLSFIAYIIDAYFINLTGFVVGGLGVYAYILMKKSLVCRQSKLDDCSVRIKALDAKTDEILEILKGELMAPIEVDNHVFRREYLGKPYDESPKINLKGELK